MDAWKADAKRIPRLLLGLCLLALGIYFTKLSGFGMAPWAIFHVGLAETTGIPFGFITQIVGVIILIGSMLLFHTKVGLGTVLNVAIVGPLIALMEYGYQTIPSNAVIQFFVFLLGLLTMTFGRSLYISSQLGQGPRDGLFVGLARSTRYQVKHIKLVLELTVFSIGVLLLLAYPTVLEQSVGVGTILVVLVSGYLVQWYFKRLGFNPKQSDDFSVGRYFQTKNPS